MPAIAFTAPIVPGKTEEGKAFFREVSDRLEEFRAARMNLPGNLTRESVWVMQTPMGDFGVVLLEGDDPVASNVAFAASGAAFDTWFKQRVADFTGVDFGQPLPKIEQLFDWHR